MILFFDHAVTNDWKLSVLNSIETTKVESGIIGGEPITAIKSMELGTTVSNPSGYGLVTEKEIADAKYVGIQNNSKAYEFPDEVARRIINRAKSAAGTVLEPINPKNWDKKKDRIIYPRNSFRSVAAMQKAAHNAGWGIQVVDLPEVGTVHNGKVVAAYQIERLHQGGYGLTMWLAINEKTLVPTYKSFG